jgi:hypothetical protein
MPSSFTDLITPRVWWTIAYIVLLGWVVFLTHPVYRNFKRRKTGFGTVFDSVSGKPIDLARIRLVDVHGLTAASAVTDEKGHYRLTAMPGEYLIDVTKPGYGFPSVFLSRHEFSKTYDNVLPSRHIKITDHGIITKNIPVDPENVDGKRSRVFRGWLLLSDNVQLGLLYACAVLALIAIGIDPWNIILWLACFFYLGIVVWRLLNFRPGHAEYGTIRNAKTGQPLEHVVLRLFDSMFNKLIQTEITSAKGRYAFLVNKGSYYVTAKLQGYTSVRLNFPNIPTDSYPLATDVKMKPEDNI